MIKGLEKIFELVTNLLKSKKKNASATESGDDNKIKEKTHEDDFNNDFEEPPIWVEDIDEKIASYENTSYDEKGDIFLENSIDDDSR